MHWPINLQNQNQRTSERGVFLIELAIVMTVISLLMIAVFPLYNSFQERNAAIETKKRMVAISKAFSNYTQIRWRLPCPADPNAVSGVQYGIERVACDVDEEDAHGIVPYRTLGIPEQYAKDAYGNFFTYVVSPDFTADNRLGVQANNVNLRLAHLVAGDVITGNYALLPRAQFCAPLNASGTDITVNQDGATLYANAARTANNVLRTRNPDPNLANREISVTAIAMTLISHGENDAGAYQSNGTQFPVAGAGPAEVENANDDNRVVQTESQFSESGTNIYDDLVMFFTQDEIYAASGNSSCEHL